MEYKAELISVLNDLITINNDRIEGYQRAMGEAKIIDVDLQKVFQRMMDQSKEFKKDLIEAIKSRGGEAELNDTTKSGKIYRVWMDVKAAFTGNHRKSVLSSCEFNEDAAQKAYGEALESDVTMDTDISQMILKQKTDLKSAHDLIKSYRDMHETAKEQMKKLNII